MSEASADLVVVTKFLDMQECLLLKYWECKRRSRSPAVEG